MPSVVFDPESGTVVDASNALLVDVDVLNAEMGVQDSDVLLSEEDGDAQELAMQVGIPMGTVYLIACTGGLEEPSFESFIDYEMARDRFEAYKSDMLRDPGDCVHFLKSDGVLSTLDSAYYNEV